MQQKLSLKSKINIVSTITSLGDSIIAVYIDLIDKIKTI